MGDKKKTLQIQTMTPTESSPLVEEDITCWGTTNACLNLLCGCTNSVSEADFEKGKKRATTTAKGLSRLGFGTCITMPICILACHQPWWLIMPATLGAATWFQCGLMAGHIENAKAPETEITSSSDDTVATTSPLQTIPT